MTTLGCECLDTYVEQNKISERVPDAVFQSVAVCYVKIENAPLMGQCQAILVELHCGKNVL